VDTTDGKVITVSELRALLDKIDQLQDPRHAAHHAVHRSPTGRQEVEQFDALLKEVHGTDLIDFHLLEDNVFAVRFKPGLSVKFDDLGRGHNCSSLRVTPRPAVDVKRKKSPSADELRAAMRPTPAALAAARALGAFGGLAFSCIHIAQRSGLVRFRRWMPLALIVMTALVLCVSGVPTVIAQSVSQKTAGPCSPAITDVKGHVTITCQGVDRKALARLNELLDKKDLQLAQKVEEANEWAQRYHEVSARLAASDDSQLSKKALALIREGKLDEAGALLDGLVAKQEAQLDQLAANHFNRGDIFRLQFKYPQARAYFDKAYQYRPDNPLYAVIYAWNRMEEQNFTKAIEVYIVLLKQLRTKPLNALLDPRKVEKVGPAIAGSLSSLARAYRGVGRRKP
jgi:tetratricopeptide (TPR) repeat protein